MFYIYIIYIYILYYIFLSLLSVDGHLCCFHILTVVHSATMNRNNKYRRRCGEMGTLVHCWWDCKLVQPLWRTVQRFL